MMGVLAHTVRILISYNITDLEECKWNKYVHLIFPFKTQFVLFITFSVFFLMHNTY
jgi:hypothetical protein